MSGKPKYLSLLQDESRVSVMGHSMVSQMQSLQYGQRAIVIVTKIYQGGHGALSIYIKNPTQFKTASAFSPIANPINCPWGQKAFSNYLGSDKETWKKYDTIELLKTHMNERLNILVDVGTADGFLEKELLIDNLKKATVELGRESEFNIRYQDGYDHSYFFISTFIADHIQYHANILKA